MTLKQSAVSGAKWTGAATAFSAAVQFAQLAVLARLLTPADFGLIAMSMVVIGFASAYVDMGISAAIVQRQEISSDVLSTLYWVNVLAGIIAFILVVAATPLVAMFFHEPLLHRLLPLVAIGFPLTAVGQQFHRLLEKELQFDLLAKQEMVVAIVAALCAIVLAWMGYGVWSLAWGFLASCALRTILLCSIGFARWPARFHFRTADLHGYLSFGLYQMGERSVNYFNSRIDQLLLGNLLGAQALGYYNFAFNLIIHPVNNINPILTRVAFPIFARIHTDTIGLRDAYIKMIKLLSTVNAPLLFGLLAVAPQAIPLVFGEKWAPAVLLVQILAVYGFLRCVNNPIGTLLLAKGRADLGFRWNVALLIATAPVVFAGAKLGGEIGVATALLILLVCSTIATYVFLVRPMLGPCARSYAAAILGPALWAGTMAACVMLVSTVGIHATALVALQIATGVVLYAALLFFADRSLVRELKGFFT